MLTPDARGILARMLTAHAYRERLAEVRYRAAVAIAPDQEGAAYFGAVEVEEKAHYRGCLAVGDAAEIALEPLVEARMRFGQRPPGIPEFTTWLDVLLAHALNDRAGYHVLTGVLGSSFSPYALLAQQITREEDRHGSNGVRMLLSYYPTCALADKDARLRDHLAAAVRCLGRPGSAGDRMAFQLGLKNRMAADTVRVYCQDADSVLLGLGLGELTPLIARLPLEY